MHIPTVQESAEVRWRVREHNSAKNAKVKRILFLKWNFFLNMGLSRPLFGFIHFWAFYNVDYNKRLTIIGHFRTMLTRHVFASGVNSSTGGSPWENESWIIKKAKRLCFSEIRCFGVMKNEKIEIIYGYPQNLSGFKKPGKAASIKPYFRAATKPFEKKSL